MWRYRLALVTITVLSLLAGAELALRFIENDPLQDLRAGRAVMIRRSGAPLVGYEFVPGSQGKACRADVVINAHGFRGSEGAPGHFIGTRVTVLGDSVAFGYGVSLASVLTSQLQARLGSSHEVLNFAVVGYDVLQEVALLQVRGLAYDPDVVVLAYCLNDIGNVTINIDYVERLMVWPWRFSRLADWIGSHVDRIERGLEIEPAYTQQIRPIAEDDAARPRA